MNELELILQAVAQLGDAGKEAFIWWLVMDKGLGVVSWLTTVAVIAFVLLRAVAPMTGTSDAKLITLRDTMGVGCPGRLTSEEYQQMLRWVATKKGTVK